MRKKTENLKCQVHKIGKEYKLVGADEFYQRKGYSIFLFMKRSQENHCPKMFKMERWIFSIVV